MQQTSVLELIAEGFDAVTSPPALEPAAEPALFQALFLPRPRRWRGLLLSALLHCACVLGLPPLMDLLPESEAQAWARHMRSMRPLQIRIPDRLYLSSAAADLAKPPAERVKPNPVADPQRVAKVETPPPAPSQAEPLRVPSREFRLPKTVRRVDADLTLIQSHLPPDLALQAQVKLPQLILLSAPVLPRPAPRHFVQPGRSAAPVVVPRVDAPPQLARESLVDPDLRIGAMLAGPETARLRLPRPTVPVRKFQAPSPLPTGRGASVSTSLGEPISLLAVSSDPAPLLERVGIPVGNQVGRLPSPPAIADTPAAGSKAAAKFTDAPVLSANGGAGPKGAGGSGDSAGAARELAELAKAVAALPPPYSTPIRIEHPVNAVFDIVVMQSSADSAFAESAGVLSGQPVYTVYLQVGAPRAWILQYCIPKDVTPAPQVVAGAVNIGSPSAVKAPYPLVSVLPPATMLARTGYIIVHGFLDISGQLKDVTILRAPNAEIRSAVLPDLLKWQFRPAVRDGGPVAVEVVLAIPPQDV